jgi:hypothetical protein
MYTYLVVNQSTNIVENKITYDGVSPLEIPGYILIKDENTPSYVWEFNNDDFILTKVNGGADIGFTWDGTAFTTNQPKLQSRAKAIVEAANNQPIATGTQTL